MILHLGFNQKIMVLVYRSNFFGPLYLAWNLVLTCKSFRSRMSTLSCLMSPFEAFCWSNLNFTLKIIITIYELYYCGNKIFEVFFVFPFVGLNSFGRGRGGGGSLHWKPKWHVWFTMKLNPCIREVYNENKMYMYYRHARKWTHVFFKLFSLMW